MLGENSKDVGEDTNLVIVANDHFVEGLSIKLTIHTVLVVNST
jgi:hypothetical protein